MSKEVQIHQFDPVLYPRKLWVVKGKDAIASIQDMFQYNDGSEISLGDFVDKFYAITMNVINKKTEDLGVLIWMKYKTDVPSIAHEFVHFARYVFNDCGMTMGFEDGKDEHFAYLVGFCADCINQVVINKFKK